MQAHFNTGSRKAWTRRHRGIFRWAARVTLLTAIAAPRPALACAACFGKSDSDLARGMNWGILSLLTVIVFVLGCIAAFFIYLARRAAATSGAENDAATAAPELSKQP